jgi:S-adenosylmethionine-dependent methyltransferase
LISHLPRGASLKILDFGGGDGRDAIWLAGMGNQVTLLDESPEMLAKAEDAVKRTQLIVRKHITLCPGNLGVLAADKDFDVILSHGVLMYEVDDPLGQLQGLASRLKTNGILSLLTKGYDAARAKSSNPEKAGQFDEVTGIYTNRLDLPTRVYRFDELEDLVSQTGLVPSARYGVRVISDNDRRSLQEVSQTGLNNIIADETAASCDPQRMERAQMIHLIATKK